MKKFYAKHVSASESGGEYFQVLFEEKEDSDKAYLLIQRQFEMPGRGYCYIENHVLSPCGHFVAKAVLSRNEFQLHVPRKERWSISFDLDDDNYEELEGILQVISSSPNHLEIKEDKID
jgi:hypothetical protein